MVSNDKKIFDEIIALCKNRGFIFSGSEIYGGLSNSWDYGPLGIEVKNNIKKAWWKKFVQQCPFNVGMDSAILMNSQIWEASGHVSGFTDPLIDCKECKTRHRADTLIEQQTNMDTSSVSEEELNKYIKNFNIKCPNCEKSNFTDIRNFNLMFKTFQGVTESSKNEIFLRPETAQGIFVNFVNVQRTVRKKIPFGIAQIGKAFRNEITPGNFIFRTREFEQMELEFFCEPLTDDKWFTYWQDFCKEWLLQLGIRENSITLKPHPESKLSHYSKATTDIEFLFPFGWGELWGIANRTDFDLKTHMEHSNKSLEYFDAVSNTKFIPYVIEPSVGVDRLLLAFICDSFDVEKISDDDYRNVLHLHPALAPYKACVLPLSKKLTEKSMEVYDKLSSEFMVCHDESGSIGKRYRRQDEIGTPFCITIDFESIEDNSVTIRDRDSMEQIRVDISKISDFINKKINF